MNYLIKYTISFVATLALAAALQLEGLSTQKPRLTKYTLKPTGATVCISWNFLCVTIILYLIEYNR